MQKADHSGHRARMKKKFMEQGIDVFEPHEVLEILLYYAIPQRNTNDIAKRLIDRFGSLSAVLDASVDRLKREGLTEHQAVFLKLIPGVTRLYLLDRYETPKAILDNTTIPSYVADKFVGREGTEHVLLLMIDKKGKELYCDMIAEGDFDQASISVRQIVTIALNHSAYAVILAHNHPSGLAVPSQEDILITRMIKQALSLVGIRLLDHYVVADHDSISMTESNLI